MRRHPTVVALLWAESREATGTRPGRGPEFRAPLLLGEIAFLGGMTIVYKSSVDLFLYVVGSSQENENVEKRWLLENLDGAFLVLDEIVDGGVILESDPQQVVQKVNFRVRVFPGSPIGSRAARAEMAGAQSLWQKPALPSPTSQAPQKDLRGPGLPGPPLTSSPDPPPPPLLANALALAQAPSLTLPLPPSRLMTVG
uniref:Coatomer subunit zeta n=1 Tax=Oryctolagus cuniculus TaxID=9986 RepID=A0A5F9DIR1_RABIT